LKITADEWLAGIFGCEVFKVALATDGAETPAALLREFQPGVRPPGFYYAKVPTQAVDQVRLLAGAGFGVVDVNITLERQPGRPDSGGEGSAAVIRQAVDRDHDPLLELAAAAFRYSRFHLDPQISPDIANANKKSWVFSYLHGLRGERLWVAEIEGRPVGFLCEMRSEVQGEPVGVIDLIGVGGAYRGRGVGTALVKSFCEAGSGRYQRLIVGTQAANIPSLRLYESCGFKVIETSYMLHAHLKAERKDL
jgi:ribosomal protein S18 acetylase RimI-like enzyme